MEYFGVPKRTFERGRQDPVFFAETILGVQLHNGQKQFLQNFLKQKHYLLEPSNQWGKSFIVSVALLYCSVYKAGIEGWLLPIDKNPLSDIEYNPLYMTPKLRQARAVYRYILQIIQSRFFWINEQEHERRFPTDYRKHSTVRKRQYRQNKCLLKDFLVHPKNVPNTQHISTTPIKFANDSFVNVIPTGGDQGASTAGDQFPVVFYDECALDNHLQETLGNYVYSRTLKYNAPIVLLSTPDEASESYAYFTQLSQQAEEDPEWKLQRGTLYDNLFYGKEQIKKEEDRLKKLDPDIYRQVFYGEHTAGRGTFFRPFEIERIFEEENTFEDPGKGREYVIGADFASGQSFTVFVVLDITDTERWDVVKVWRCKGNEYSPDYQLEVLIDLARDYNDAAVGIDASSLAGPLIESRLHRLNLYSNSFSGSAKQEVLLALKKALTYKKEGRVRAPAYKDDKTLQAVRRELITYTEKDRKRVKDCVMAMGLACWTVFQLWDEGIVDRPFELNIFDWDKKEERELEYENAKSTTINLDW